MSAIVWFRQDLRLDDHLALLAALKNDCPILPLYLWSPEDEGGFAPGRASRWWLRQSLEHLHQELKRRGSRLVLKQAKRSQSALLAIARQIDAKAVYFGARYEPHVFARDAGIKSALRSRGIHAESFNNSLLFDPFEIQPHQTLPAFCNACKKNFNRIPFPKPAPAKLPPLPKKITSSPLSLIDPDQKKIATSKWNPGEKGATEALFHFLNQDSPYSHLSPYLHFGEISIRHLFHFLKDSGDSTLIQHLLKREFAYHLLAHFPRMPKEPLHAAFNNFPWQHNPSHLKAWQEGRTGYPMIDASMRELSYSGWLPNKARLLTASFLTKDLLLPWQQGAAWFWDSLVDADLANNTQGWQWSAGCGENPDPFTHIPDPVAQGKHDDPEGRYIRTWLPELRHLPTSWIHNPWEAPHQTLQDAGVELGINYPYPIVDHQRAKERAVDIYKHTMDT